MKKIISLLLLLQNSALFCMSDVDQNGMVNEQEQSEPGHFFSFKIDASLIDLSSFEIVTSPLDFRFALNTAEETSLIIGRIEEKKAVVYGFEVKKNKESLVLEDATITFHYEFPLELRLNPLKARAFFDADSDTLTIFIPELLDVDADVINAALDAEAIAEAAQNLEDIIIEEIVEEALEEAEELALADAVLEDADASDDSDATDSDTDSSDSSN